MPSILKAFLIAERLLKLGASGPYKAIGLQLGLIGNRLYSEYFVWCS